MGRNSGNCEVLIRSGRGRVNHSVICGVVTLFSPLFKVRVNVFSAKVMAGWSPVGPWRGPLAVLASSAALPHEGHGEEFRGRLRKRLVSVRPGGSSPNSDVQNWTQNLLAVLTIEF